MHNFIEKFWNKEVFNYGGYPLTRREIFKLCKNEGFDDKKIDGILYHNTKESIGIFEELKDNKKFKKMREVAEKELNIKLKEVK